jgi:hypothetical protein
MATLAMALPILPGKTDDFKAFMAELNGPKLGEFEASEANIGLVQEGWFLQSTPMGDLAVVHVEGNDPLASFGAFVGSDRPFDVWYKDRIKDLTGVDLTQPAPPPEKLMDWQATARV